MARHPSETCGRRRASATPAPVGPRRAKRSWTACLLLAGALAGGPTAPAMGWRAEVSASGVLTIDGGAAANALRVRDGGALVLVTDEGDGFTGATPAGCVLTPNQALSCPLPVGGVLVRG